ncbi:MAG: fumarylacetoacetate hydrolase family protein [Planctomycetota bacterium]|jgi:2-keto-4-pentenoate hydratase/2-oxohepta-3-ene-1,7-dioic acid hydratase in catechol pathway
MRLCRFEHDGQAQVGFYSEESIIPLSAAADFAGVTLDAGDSLIRCLPGGELRDQVLAIEAKLKNHLDEELGELKLDTADVRLLVPNPNPTKLLLLAGNYAKHIEEGGGRAEERARTFPYVFMKPPLTTLTNPGDPVRIPEISPDHIDWELELGIVIGKQAKGVAEADALNYVAGYTVVNDISDRKFKPNPDRTEREKDGFFDWLHGKWHDTFCPMGPCVLPTDDCPDPQQLHLTLKVNGEVEQDGSTAEMVFPVAAIVEFISSYVTLEPGDIISTGTTSGVGAAKGKFLKSGDQMEASIEHIGVLRNPVV